MRRNRRSRQTLPGRTPREGYARTVRLWDREEHYFMRRRQKLLCPVCLRVAASECCGMVLVALPFLAKPPRAHQKGRWKEFFRVYPGVAAHVQHPTPVGQEPDEGPL
jgi:hypothetical protein